MANKSTKTFGDLTPWGEPAWYNVLDSPYYGESHRKLRAFVRDYVDNKILPFQEEWEETGVVPAEVRDNARLSPTAPLLTCLPSTALSSLNRDWPSRTSQPNIDAGIRCQPVFPMKVGFASLAY
jgi:hypothetical protein